MRLGAHFGDSRRRGSEAMQRRLERNVHSIHQQASISNMCRTQRLRKWHPQLRCECRVRSEESKIRLKGIIKWFIILLFFFFIII